MKKSPTERMREWRLKNPERDRKRKGEYYQKNKKELDKKKKIWVLNNPEKIKEYSKKYRKNNREKIRVRFATGSYKKYKKEYDKIYRANNKEHRNEYLRNRRRKDPNFKLAYYCRIRVRQVLKGKRKSKSTLELLGCSVEELWVHLENKFIPGMTRNNYGQWHVDHIKPCASFDFLDPEQQEKCFHYTNLQPLWAIDNMKKGSKIILGDIISPKM